MRRTVERLAAFSANAMLTRLRNREDLKLTREEFRYSRISFSVFGEDLAVCRWLDERLPDTVPKIYVDAGCFHPIHCSNTLLLHKRGWRGFNIDMVPEKIEVFRRLRPGDTNTVAALSSSAAAMHAHQYQHGLVDRLQPAHTPSAAFHQGRAPLHSREVVTTTLDAVLGDAGPIGYLNVDCEGHDIEVIMGFDLGRFRPAIITIEALDDGARAATTAYLTNAGYDHRETLHFTMLFIRRDMDLAFRHQVG